MPELDEGVVLRTETGMPVVKGKSAVEEAISPPEETPQQAWVNRVRGMSEPTIRNNSDTGGPDADKAIPRRREAHVLERELAAAYAARAQNRVLFEESGHAADLPSPTRFPGR